MNKSTLKKSIAVILFSTSFGHGGIVSDIIDDVGSNLGQNLLGSLLGGDNIFGTSFGIPGIGNIQVQCKQPSFNLPSLDICSVFDTFENKFPAIPDFNYGWGGCHFSLRTDIDKCKKNKLKSLCKSTLEEKEAEFSKVLSGIGGYDELGTIKMSIFGGKGTFGENANSDERYKEFESDTMKEIYGEDGFTIKTLTDPDIGGKMSMANTRRQKMFLDCVETAKRKGITNTDCYLVGLSYGKMTSSEIEGGIQNTSLDMISKGSRELSGDLAGRVDQFWALFYEKAKAKGLKNWKIALAIGMHESKLIPDAVGALNSNGSQDFGIMQVNNKYHTDPVLKAYPGHGTFAQTISIAWIGVEYGIKYFVDDCVNREGSVNNAAINCFNKGYGGRGNNDGYVDKVMAEYAKIKDRDFGVPSEPWENDVYTSRTISTTATIASNATRRQRTIVNSGEDYIQYIPKNQRSRYKQIVNRYMAQQVIINSSFKKVSEIEKALSKLASFAYETGSGGSDTTSGGTEE